jgi:hypothetical protein
MFPEILCWSLREGVSGGRSGITGYQPGSFESKQLIPHEKTVSDFKEKAVPPCEWRKKK